MSPELGAAIIGFVLAATALIKAITNKLANDKLFNSISQKQDTDIQQRDIIIAELRKEIEHNKEELNEVKQEYTGIKNDIKELPMIKKDVEYIKEEHAGLKTDVREIKTNVSDIKVSLADISGFFKWGGANREKQEG